MAEAFIIDAARSPLCPVGGALAQVGPVALASAVIRALLSGNEVPGEAFDAVLLGSDGAPDADLARLAALDAGLPVPVQGHVALGSGSGQQSIHDAATSIVSGHRHAVIAGAVALGPRPVRTAPVPTAVAWRTTPVTPDVSAALLTARHALSDQVVDARVARSRSAAADTPGPVVAAGAVDADISPATSATAAADADGAALVLMASADAVRNHGLRARARIVSMAVGGADPTVRYSALARAATRALGAAGMELSEIDLFEVDERFAAVPEILALQLGAAPERINVSGGALALGHAGAAEGPRMLGTLLTALEQRDLRHGLVLVDAGWGQAIATLIDREFYV